MSLNFLTEDEEFKNLIHAIKHKKKGCSISGIIKPSKPYFLTVLQQELKKKVIFIQPSTAPLQPFGEQCQFFLAQFGADPAVDFLPPLSESPYQEIFPALDVVSTRMKFIFNLIHHSPALVITNLFGLLKPLPSPPNAKRFFLKLETGEFFPRDRLLQSLGDYGYKQEDVINSHGEYARRGGIVDVFSPWHFFPLRIEFSGDEIVSLREFDPSSQYSIRKKESFILPSLREYPVDPQFLQEWEKLAADKRKTPLFNDVWDKADLLRKGEFFPSFVYLSLLHREHFVPFCHYLKDSLFIIDDCDEVEKDWKESLKDLHEQFNEFDVHKKFSLPPEEIYPPDLWERIKGEAIEWKGIVSSVSKKTFFFPFQSVPKFENKIPFFLKYLKKIQKERDRCFIYFSNPGIRKKLASLLSQHNISCFESSSPFVFPEDGAIALLVGNLSRGFSFPKLKILYFSEKDIFTEEQVLVRRSPAKPFVSHFQDLKTGDYVVHTDCGIGIFKGLVKMNVDSKSQEFIEIFYKDGDKLFVPVEDLNLVQKYAKVSANPPVLNKLGTPAWEKTKTRVKKAIEKMATELLALYARRKAVKGYSFSPEGAWQEDFERTFEFEETEDQWGAIKEIMQDMEAEFPMDRLLCGDVGYGKTEVGIRAAFKAVMDGKQVVVLCPTTVLASQHLKTFRNRMVLFPIRIEGLSRLQSKAKQKRIVDDLKKGLVDILVGTHRVLSKDVEFRDLGLLIIDEEQRFGVRQKEKIKEMSINVDVLTLTATPIPRTLNLSLTGLRDMSLIETPPKDRLAIHTVVTPFSRKLIAGAVKKELARGGQVYFIHNRIQDIEKMAQMLKKWVLEAKPVTMHGQMPPSVIEKRMMDFIEQRYNALVSTTIIENGIDIPRVNTLLVNRADRFGLAQLYQLRGRVGRSSRQAVAYFLVPPVSDLTPDARERLKALQEFSELGSGFRLAAKDLEIRGAGNFLGSQQHGYLEAVGFDYYMHLLENAIRELKGDKPEEFKSHINLKVDIRIPEDYLPQISLRLNLYKKISSAESLEELEKIKDEITDRYGPIPLSVQNLLHYGVIKYLAQKLKIKAIDRVGYKIIFKFFPASSVKVSSIAQLLKRFSGAITPQGVMSLTLTSEGEDEVMHETVSILKELSLI